MVIPVQMYAHLRKELPRELVLRGLKGWPTIGECGHSPRRVCRALRMERRQGLCEKEFASADGGIIAADAVLQIPRVARGNRGAGEKTDDPFPPPRDVQSPVFEHCQRMHAEQKRERAHLARAVPRSDDLPYARAQVRRNLMGMTAAHDYALALRAIDARADVLHPLSAWRPSTHIIKVVFTDLDMIEVEAFGEQRRRTRRGGEKGKDAPRRVGRTTHRGGEGHEVFGRADRLATTKPDAAMPLERHHAINAGGGEKLKGRRREREVGIRVVAVAQHHRSRLIE